MKEQWRKEMTELLIKIIQHEFIATPGHFSYLSKILLTLREIMLLDDLNHTYSKEALTLIKNWMKSQNFDLSEALEEHKEFVKRIKEIKG
jgi:predicted unusual protein kinase regulating ubiquinone biosynthesis (AarF/ABC1/UbiB family)